MKQFKIEKGIPMPESRAGRPGGRWSNTLPHMKKGDSFWVKGPQRNSAANVFCWAKRHGGKFSTRVVGKGVRIWRVK